MSISTFSGQIARPHELLPQDRKILRELIWQWLHGTTDGAVALKASRSPDSALEAIEKLLSDGFMVASYDPDTEQFTLKTAGARI